MKETYTVKYRQPGQIFWRTVKNVKGDGVEGMFRFFSTEDDRIIYVSCNAEVIFPAERQALITQKMSREIGQPVQRA